jgi:hypothetical protein
MGKLAGLQYDSVNLFFCLPVLCIFSPPDVITRLTTEFRHEDLNRWNRLHFYNQYD